MKKIILFVLVLLAIYHNANAGITYEIARKGAQAKVVFKVVDQEGAAVQGAKIWGGFTTGEMMNDYAIVDGFTDKDGLFVAENRCNEILRVDVKKDGYYPSEIRINFWQSKSEPIVVEGKWQPYGETKEVILKKIKNPVRIGEFGRCSIPIPVYNQWVGFDLELREWVPPYGKGNYSDVMLKFGRELIHRQTDFKMTMDVSFENNKYAGCYLMNVDSFSEKKTVYKADENANFIPTMSFIQERHPGAKRIDNRIDKDSYLVFRTRTKVDEKGNLISAHYGIIRGEWAFFNSMLSAGYLFNPISNDTNLEDAETARKARMNN